MHPEKHTGGVGRGYGLWSLAELLFHIAHTP